MPRLRQSHRVLLVLAAVVPVGVYVAVATGAIPGSDGTITACYSASTGRLRVVDTESTPPQHCSSKERQLSWSQQGPAGAPGPAGPAGPPGPQGAASCDASRLLVCPDADLPDGETVTITIDGIPVLQGMHRFRAYCTTADRCKITVADEGSAPVFASTWYQAAAQGDPTARKDFTLAVVDASSHPISTFFVRTGVASSLLFDGADWQLTLSADALQPVSS